jgi:hypothetical protein
MEVRQSRFIPVEAMGTDAAVSNEARCTFFYRVGNDDTCKFSENGSKSCSPTEEVFPPPKIFARSPGSKAQQRSVRKELLGNESGGIYRKILSLQAPSTRPVYNRKIGVTILEAERRSLIHCVSNTIELDDLLRSL